MRARRRADAAFVASRFGGGWRACTHAWRCIETDRAADSPPWQMWPNGYHSETRVRCGHKHRSGIAAELQSPLRRHSLQRVCKARTRISARMTCPIMIDMHNCIVDDTLLRSEFRACIWLRASAGTRCSCTRCPRACTTRASSSSPTGCGRRRTRRARCRTDRFRGWPSLCGFTIRVRPFLPALPVKSCVRAFL